MEVGFGVSYAQVKPTERHSLPLLPVGQDTELSAPSPAPCLPASYRVSSHDDNGLSL